MNNKQQQTFVFPIRIITLLTLFATPFATSYAANDANTPPQTTTAKVDISKATLADKAELAVNAGAAMNPTTAVPDAPDVPPAKTVQDPYEGFNRVMFGFNEKVDLYALKPVATFYNTIMPKPLNQGIHNFYNNIGELPTIANDILQLNFYQMANDMWRFAINSTIGVLGFFDVASRMGLNYYANDFGLTLATYGWKNSNYVVLPFLGPNTVRDVVEIPVDYYAFSVYPYVEPQSRRYELYGVGIVDRRAQLLQYQGVFDEVAVDKYVFMRNAYMQRRAYQIEQNRHLGYKDQQAAKVDKDSVIQTTTS